MLGGTGKGNVFSGVAYRDMPCIIFRRLEKNKLGAIIISSYNE